MGSKGRTLQDHDIRNMKRDEMGRVKVYDPTANRGQGEWRWVPYVDAAEMLKVGTANLEGPADLSAPVPNPARNPPVDTGQDNGGSTNDPPETYDFNKHSVDELKAFASQAKLTVPNNASKAKLSELLDKSGFRPDQE